MSRMKDIRFTYSFDPAACRLCTGFCCRGRSGNIWLNTEEITRIARYLQTNQVDVVSKYLRPIDNRLSIREQYENGEYACVFFDGTAHRCTIYEVRPFQCRRFPFWPYYIGREKELLSECPGVSLVD